MVQVVRELEVAAHGAAAYPLAHALPLACSTRRHLCASIQCFKALPLGSTSPRFQPHAHGRYAATRGIPAGIHDLCILPHLYFLSCCRARHVVLNRCGSRASRTIHLRVCHSAQNSSLTSFPPLRSSLTPFSPIAFITHTLFSLAFRAASYRTAAGRGRQQHCESGQEPHSHMPRIRPMHLAHTCFFPCFSGYFQPNRCGSRGSRALRAWGRTPPTQSRSSQTSSHSSFRQVGTACECVCVCVCRIFAFTSRFACTHTHTHTHTYPLSCTCTEDAKELEVVKKAISDLIRSSPQGLCKCIDVLRVVSLISIGVCWRW